MATFSIPFSRGQHEEADEKLLPQGLFTSLQNARYKKDGRLGVRNGYALASGTAGQPVGAGDFGPKHSVYVRDRVAAGVSGTWFDHRPDGVFTGGSVQGTAVTSVGVPRRLALVRNISGTVMSSDIAQNQGFVFVAWQGYDLTTGVSSGVFLSAYESKSGRLVATQLVDSSGTNPKLTIIGTGLASDGIYVFFADSGGAAIKYGLFTFSGSAFTIVTIGLTLVSAAAGRNFSFDVCPNNTTTCILAYESGAATIRVGTVDLASVFTQIYTQATTNPARIALAKLSTGNIAMAYAMGATFNTGNLSYRIDTPAGASVVAATSLDSSGLVSGYPVAGPSVIASGVAILWMVQTAGLRQLLWFRTGNIVTNLGYNLTPVSRPFTGYQSSCLCWCVDENYHGLIGTIDGAFPTYRLVDLDYINVGFTATNVGGQPVEASACQGAALSGANYLTSAAYQTQLDPRRSTVSLTSLLTVPSPTAVGTVLPVLGSGKYDADLVRLDSAQLADRLMPAKIGGELYFSGSRIATFDGSQFHEAGFLQFPEYVSATANATGGTLSAGIYQYVALYVWYDAAGRKYRSAPSIPITVTAVANGSISLTVAAPHCSDKYKNGLNIQVTSVAAEIYRTLVGEDIFQLVNATKPLTWNAAGSVSVYVDTISDATLAAQELIYTQGVEGGNSGLLENDEPPPCRFLWAGSDRLIAGGLEIAEQVQFSKLRVDGEPMQWHNDVLYKLRVGGEVTSVAEMDGTWFIFCRDVIYASQGAGPSDNGTGDPFGEPQKLPADFGCVSNRSMLLTGAGLVFQSQVGFAIIARGGGAPTRAFGDVIRDTVTSFPLCSASVYNQATGTAYWAMLNSAGTAGRLLVFDTRINEWSVDNVNNGRAVKTLDVYNDLLVIDGQLVETPGVYLDNDGSTSTNVVPIWITGDIRAFGPNGWGRYRKVQLLAEARDVTVAWTLQLDVSYDSGKTFGETATWTRANLATAIGDAIDGAEHMFVTQRADAVRLRGTLSTPSATEGVVFNALSLEVFQTGGLKKQPNTMRAP